jgi:hypothetical protein
MTRVAQIIWLWIWAAPFLIGVLGLFSASFASRRRWPIHVGVAVIALSFPLFIDALRSDGGPPGPGDGFVLMLYLLTLLPSVVMYGAFAWVLAKAPK